MACIFFVTLSAFFLAKAALAYNAFTIAYCLSASFWNSAASSWDVAVAILQ